MTRFAPAALERWAVGVLSAAGAGDDAARVTARHLVDANRRGLDTHGLAILRLYLPRLARGAVDGAAQPEVVTDRPGLLVVDGHNALGPYVADFAVRAGCERAREAGAAVVLVRRSNHFGAASCFSELAAAHDCVAIVGSNSDPGLAPPGALGPVLGTNPIAIAAPGADGEPHVSLDIATSVVALGKVRAAQRAGERLPPGWAIGPDGAETDDPAVALAGSMLPVGGHKGFGLALMLDVLSGCLTGAATSPQITGDPEDPRPQGTGHFVVCVHVPAARPLPEYRESLRDLVDAVRGAPRADGTPAFLVPGEPESRAAQERREAIPIDAGTLELLSRLGERFGAPFPEAA